MPSQALISPGLVDPLPALVHATPTPLTRNQGSSTLHTISSHLRTTPRPTTTPLSEPACPHCSPVQLLPVVSPKTNNPPSGRLQTSRYAMLPTVLSRTVSV